jgi:DNA invertase Pin-like site-specific DNA recombinase
MRIGYARVSTKKDDQKQALEQQIDRLRCAGAKEIFIDIESGGCDDRKELLRVLELVRSRLCSEVIVTHQTRLGRSIVGIQKVVDVFRSSGVKLTVLDGSGDLATAAGRAHVANMAVWAQYERELISERVSNGWEYVRKRQKAVNAPFGYQIVDEKYVLDRRPLENGTDRASVAREIVDTFLKVRSLRATVREVASKYPELLPTVGETKGLPKSTAGLRDWLLNPVLQGHLRYFKRKPEEIIHYNTHPLQRLMSDLEGKEIEKILAFNREHHGFVKTTPSYPLSGLIYCTCGTTAHLIGNEAAGGKYYQCRKYTLGQCDQKKAVRVDRALSAVVEKLISTAEAIADIAEQDPDYVEPPELVELRAELAYYEKAPGKRALVIVAQLKAQIEQQILQAKQQSQAHLVNRELLLRVFGDRFFWTTMPDTDKRICFQNLVKRVTIRDGAVVEVELSV